MRVLIIGAGPAGLTCGRILHAHGFEVTILEASDGVGGRVRSDYVDGFILDRGFQVLFDAYPAVRRHLDLPALDLRAFDPGAIICLNGRQTVLTDPLRDHGVKDVLATAITPAATLRDKVRTLMLFLQLRRQSIQRILAGKMRQRLLISGSTALASASSMFSFGPFSAASFSNATFRQAPSASSMTLKC